MALTETERGLLWAILHQPEAAARALQSLQDNDIEGLASESLLRKAMELAWGDADVLPNALMERLTDREARTLTQAGAERQAPVTDLSACVEALRRIRVRRELVDLDREIAQLSSREPDSPRLTELVLKKIAIRRQLGET